MGRTGPKKGLYRRFTRDSMDRCRSRGGFGREADHPAGEKRPMNAYDVLKERGFVEQVSDEDNVRAMLERPITCYVGFDTTADSLHAGSLVPIMALAHMQRCGHRVIVLIGGGTTLIGDPSSPAWFRPS